MDNRRFDNLARAFAHNLVPSRRALLRTVLVGTIGGLIPAAKANRGTAQATCEPDCARGEACLGGTCVKILDDDALCLPACPSGFVCSGGRCVEQVVGECGPCELFDPTAGCYFACPAPKLCFDGPFGWYCSSRTTPRPCYFCDGRHCRYTCAADENCVDDKCLPCASICAGVVTCGKVSTSDLCCLWPDYAACVCESRPGAGDGYIGCCGRPGNPCPKEIPAWAIDGRNGVAFGCDKGDRDCRSFAVAGVAPDPYDCGGSGGGVVCGEHG